MRRMCWEQASATVEAGGVDLLTSSEGAHNNINGRTVSGMGRQTLLGLLGADNDDDLENLPPGTKRRRR